MGTSCPPGITSRPRMAVSETTQLKQSPDKRYANPFEAHGREANDRHGSRSPRQRPRVARPRRNPPAARPPHRRTRPPAPRKAAHVGRHRSRSRDDEPRQGGATRPHQHHHVPPRKSRPEGALVKSAAIAAVNAGRMTPGDVMIIIGPGPRCGMPRSGSKHPCGFPGMIANDGRCAPCRSPSRRVGSA